MRCPRCHAENPAGMKFCGQCAAPLASGCPSCGAANPPGHRFCGQCAAPLTVASRPPGPKFTSPQAYELTRAGTVRSRIQAAAVRGLTRFVGRDSELDQLRQALERARAGHGQVVAVVGEPGVGKSRLYWEFTHSHRAQGWLILESGSVSYGKANGRPLSVWHASPLGLLAEKGLCWALC